MSTYPDPLEAALLRYFGLRSAAIGALTALSDLAGDTGDLRRRVFRLQTVLQGTDLLDAGSEVDLIRCLEVAEGHIAAGTQRHFMPDEHCLSGGGYMTHLSTEAEHISEAIYPLQLLRTAWRDVQAARATEKALDSLRS